MQKTALITGITGQDGSYLAEFLLNKGYKVYGLVRRRSTPNTERIDHIKNKITFIEGDLSDMASLIHAIQKTMPDEIYNLAAMSFVHTSWESPLATADMTGVGVARLLDAVRLIKKDTRVYQASSSEMFGKAIEVPQTEKTAFHPRSPYGVAKTFGHYITVNYRESYNMYCCSGILFNHESPRRGYEFVTRKISDGVARIKLGLSNEIRLGNLDAKRDWGFAKDYIEAMWLMLQQDKAEDYVIATGETHSVREFLDIAFKYVNIEDWQKYIKIDPTFIRPAEVDLLLGDYTKAKQKLGWEPKVKFKELVEMMVNDDIQKLKKEYRLQ